MDADPVSWQKSFGQMSASKFGLAACRHAIDVVSASERAAKTPDGQVCRDSVDEADCSMLLFVAGRLFSQNLSCV